MENERERLNPGQVRPRCLFLGASPIGSQSGFTHECGLRAIRFQNSDEHARPRWQRKRLFRPNLAFLVDFGFDSWKHGTQYTSVNSSLPHIRSGKLRALAVTLPKRSPVVPDLPTIVEAGVPGVVVVNWYGLVAPLGTPLSVIERLSRGVGAAMSHPEVVKRLLADGSDAATSTPDQFRAHIAEERDKWTRVIRNAGIRM